MGGRYAGAMPLTPFHLGPAVVLKAACPRQFSLGTFALVQVVIDVETVWNILAGNWPIHSRLHTLAGSLLVAIAVIVPGKYSLSGIYAALRHRLAELDGTPAWVLTELGPLSWTSASAGAIVGGVSHVLLDAVIHGDVAPFAPWSRDNPFLVPGSFVWVHLLCAAVGPVGLLLWHTLAKRGGT